MVLDKDQDSRFLQDPLARLFVVSILVLWFGACASPPAAGPGKGTGPGIVVVPAGKTGLFNGPAADAAMLNEAMLWLGLSGKPADYAKARETFAGLTKSYPQSKWRPLAETFIQLIDAMASLQVKNLSVQELAEKLQQDNERLKKDIQALGNRVQADRESLLLENEQLKKDMELLRKLEVQLDKREKMLR